MENETRLIDANALWHKTFTCEDAADVRKEIENAPTVDAAPVVHGHWAHLGGDEWCCTVCGEVIHTEGSWEKPDKKFCYECGAIMDGGNEDGNL